ncbi:MAG: hypothetical protein COV34_01890 [Candidatus Zambryskibacteria bacterium CG10_big_fil_rev_8_21_14_0_10_42_12]|uniref:Uncharacterized protein n=1 Tax=Candidatus Zambryskibacteria bacterium CG10_big_fil_rev_8_21_14_0_10_42_12 TaxID=1975115 RepID=A0A2H0QVS2_9BACT|nr:MAG: hypothetical protein COV34_01890 [Candidatus Zambryskibacteria bacterium CG10_big_fil_rev_8_21_14_0_10_42_12]
MIFSKIQLIVAVVILLLIGLGAHIVSKNNKPIEASEKTERIQEKQDNNLVTNTKVYEHDAVLETTTHTEKIKDNLETTSKNQVTHAPISYNTEALSMTRWHAPGAHDGLNPHEHGDEPPAWANEWSIEKFGHPVIWGGDESTPKENEMKHQAYKGYSMTASGVELYIRFHAQSNPHGRSGPLHSYEVYAKDQSGGVSFWQGWMFFGYPEMRNQRMTRAGEFGGYDDTYGITWPGRDQFIIASPDQEDWNDYKRCEQWYGTANSFLSWDFGLTICEASTFFIPDEHKGDIMNKDTWNKTGAFGLKRRLEVSHYGPENPTARNELSVPIGAWYCVKKVPNENRAAGEIPTWDHTSAVVNQNNCDNGWLPQYIAPTFPKVGIYFKTGNTEDKLFPGEDIVSLPN